jgi:hypothetical protein
LPSQLQGGSVVLDCEALVVATPSFFDEIVKEILVARGADRLDIVAGSGRAGVLAQTAADNRGVADRLRVISRAA